MFREATVEDAEAILPLLRPADIREVKASSDKPPLETLKESITTSDECFVCTIKGKIAGVFGVATWDENPNVGIIWMVGTEVIEKYPKKFFRTAKEYIEESQKKWPLLTNIVDARNNLHIKCLLRLGCKFTNVVEEHGPEKRPFVQFMRTKQSCVRPQP